MPPCAADVGVGDGLLGGLGGQGVEGAGVEAGPALAVVDAVWGYDLELLDARAAACVPAAHIADACFRFGGVDGVGGAFGAEDAVL